MELLGLSVRLQPFRYGSTSLWIYRIIRFTLACFFIVAGLIKLQRPEVFAVTIDAFGLVPRFLIPSMAFGLPVLEILSGVGLIFDVRGSLGVVAGLTLLFMAVLAYGIWLGLDIDCGCYGPSDPESEAFGKLRSSLYRDLAMAAGILYLYLWRRAHAVKPCSPMDWFDNQRFKKGES